MFDFDDVCQLIHERIRKARKRHRCTECKGSILPGQYYKYFSTLFDNSWSHHKMCQSCQLRLTEAEEKHGSFGYYFGDLLTTIEYMNEKADCVSS